MHIDGKEVCYVEEAIFNDWKIILLLDKTYEHVGDIRAWYGFYKPETYWTPELVINAALAVDQHEEKTSVEKPELPGIIKTASSMWGGWSGRFDMSLQEFLDTTLGS